MKMMMRLRWRPRQLRRLFFSTEERSIDDKSWQSLDTFVERDSISTVLSNLDDYRQPFHSIVKDIFRGRIETGALSYPDVLHNDRYYNLFESVDRIRSVLKGHTNYSNEVNKDMIDKIKSLGCYHGLGDRFGVTETARLWEELSFNMSLSETFYSARHYGVTPILKFGSIEHRDRYLTGLLNGDIIAGFCVCDEESGSDITNSNVVAIRDQQYDNDQSIFTLKGTKLLVSNAQNADLFVVFANVVSRVSGRDKEFTAFLIPASTPGVSVSSDRDRNVGLKGLVTASVTFDNVKLTEADILGDIGEGRQVYIESVSDERRLYTAARISAALRLLMDHVVTHTLSSVRFGAPLSQFSSVRHKLASMASKLYALESMIYMTCGLADVQSERDFGMDALVCKLYANRSAEYILNTGFDILGERAYDQHEPMFSTLARDLEAYRIWEGTDDVLKMFLALKGLEYAKDKPASMLGNFFIDFINKRRSSNKQWFMNEVIKLRNYVHPGLELNANMTENSVLNLGYRVRNAIKFKEQDDDFLIRLADSVILCSTMVSVLGRANRSYCDGHPHAQLEKYLCAAHVKDADLKIRLAIADLCPVRHNAMKSVQRLINRGEFCSHPIK